MITYDNVGPSGPKYSALQVMDAGGGEIEFEVINGPVDKKNKGPRNVMLNKAQAEHLYNALAVHLGHAKKIKKIAGIEGDEI